MLLGIKEVPRRSRLVVGFFILLCGSRVDPSVSAGLSRDFRRARDNDSGEWLCACAYVGGCCANVKYRSSDINIIIASSELDGVVGAICLGDNRIARVR